MVVMTTRRPLLLLAFLPALLAAEQAQAADTLGTPDSSAAPDAYACEVARCAPGQSVGFRQFALQGATVTAVESGVLVSARVYAKRIAGAEQPRIAVLSPAEGDGIGVTVGDFSPLPVVSRGGAVHEVTDLHLPIEAGDALGFLLPTGQVDVGVVNRPRPDGAVQWFSEPCEPCSMDGGTGTELLFEGTIEPDFDEDGLGDETQDPDAGFGFDELDDEWLDDWDDELDEDEEAAPRRGRRGFQLLGLALAPNGDPVLKIRAPRAGRLSGNVTTSAGSWDIVGNARTIGAGQSRSRRAGPVRLRLHLTRRGHQLVDRRGRLKARVVVSIQSKSALQVAMRRIRLRDSSDDRDAPRRRARRGAPGDAS
jgi:hypothetical protein